MLRDLQAEVLLGPKSCKPAAATTCLRCPKALKVHHALGALKMPMPSYTTTWLSLAIPSASIAAANLAALGSMCGSGLAVSETLSAPAVCQGLSEHGLLGH